MPGPKLYPPPEGVTGLPTPEELEAIPRLYSWERLKEIVASGELGDLKRHPILADRYGPWCVDLAKKYGSTEQYLVTVRLPWSTPPASYGHSTPSLTHGKDPVGVPTPRGGTPLLGIDGDERERTEGSLDSATGMGGGRADGKGRELGGMHGLGLGLGAGAGGAVEQDGRSSKVERDSGAGQRSGSSTFQSREDIASSSASADYPPASAARLSSLETDGDAPLDILTFNEGDELDTETYAVLPNDWPYNVPRGVDHCLVWSKKPIFHPSLARSPTHWAQIQNEGFAGFTGTSHPPGSIDVRGRRKGDWCTPGGEGVDRMVRGLWPVEEFECAWFVNPPRLQSVRGLSHFHVFVRDKARHPTTSCDVEEP